jgi:hypothetical protein
MIDCGRVQVMALYFLNLGSSILILFPEPMCSSAAQTIENTPNN